MSTKKLPFISSVSLVQIDGRSTIPTAIYYDGDKRAHIGYEAKDRCASPEQLLEDFKIELGQHDPDHLTKRTASAAHTPRVTVAGVAQDYFKELLAKVNECLDRQGRPVPTNVLIAEPLALSGIDMAEERWLSNYRKAIQRALYGKFEQIDFLPEPFAVFQYYRYGLRHPTIAEQRKHVALVLDFGGGTFDISVIETTKTGEISGGGKNSRPLSAKSVQIGGFFINRLLAENLIMKAVDKDLRAEVRKSLARAEKTKTPDDLYQLNDREKIFYRNYKRLMHSVEGAKISLCNSISNWSLDADVSSVTPFSIPVPIDPYALEPRMGSVKMDAGLLRNIFENNVWKPKLCDAIKTTILRAARDLKGQDISVVLLSGGSANIRWLSYLLKRDLGKDVLSRAEILQLSENFQEIVAKGLATECARRFYTEGQGDFRAVTYNPLCLALAADNGPTEVRRARPTTPELAAMGNVGTDDGILLPSASSLKGLVDRPLTWKVRLSSPPKHTLNYFFMRSSFDPHDLEARHNIVETRAPTPSKAHFDKAIEVELTVRDDGTATPNFIYGRNDRSAGVIASGKPFHIDMTFASEEVGGSTYLGFDFGTSSSACSFVDSADVQMIQERSRSADWRELSELVSELPYPVAAPLAQFISEMDADRRNKKGREAAEALLTLAAYVAYTDTCSEKAPGAFFKGFSQRSAGPLWALIKSCVGRTTRLDFAAPLASLVRPESAAQIDDWISGLNSDKHGRAQAVDWVSFLKLLANCVVRVFDGKWLGVFEGVVAKRFHSGSYTGIFRVLHGPSQTFIDVFDYAGSHPFSDELVFVVDPASGNALELSPLYFWGLLRDPHDPTAVDMFEFDHEKKARYGFKTTQSSEGLEIEEAGDWVAIHQQIAAMRVSDQCRAVVTGLALTSHES